MRRAAFWLMILGGVFAVAAILGAAVAGEFYNDEGCALAVSQAECEAGTTGFVVMLSCGFLSVLLLLGAAVTWALGKFIRR